jgi:hypothetical protein
LQKSRTFCPELGALCAQREFPENQLRQFPRSVNASELLVTLLQRTQELTPNTHDFSPAHDGSLRRRRPFCRQFARSKFLGDHPFFERGEFSVWRFSVVGRQFRKHRRQQFRDELSLGKPE